MPYVINKEGNGKKECKVAINANIDNFVRLWITLIGEWELKMCFA